MNATPTRQPDHERWHSPRQLIGAGIVLVLLILVLHENIILSPPRNFAQECRVARAKHDLGTLSTAIRRFAFEYGRLPGWLDEIADRLDGGVPEDPWGNGYEYRPIDGEAFELTSFGADGEPGGTGFAADLRPVARETSDNLALQAVAEYVRVPRARGRDREARDRVE